MKKKIIIITSAISALSLSVAVFALAQKFDGKLTKGDASYQIVLNDKDAVEEQEGGLYHQITVKNNKFDMVGWSSEGGDFGSIKKATMGNYLYNGMIYNRSLINGFESLKVTFSNGSLNYVFSDFLMENMDFDGVPLTSGEEVYVPNNEAYFIVYNTSETAVNIESLEVRYECDGSIDSEMLFNKETDLGYARSGSKRTVKDDSFVVLENNPNQYNNNYSTGKNGGHTNNDSWYRFNGRYFTRSEDLGLKFTFAMTIMGEYGLMTDDTKNFHYNVWPQFSYGNPEDEPWVQTYIGNDNYEPLGHDHALRPSDPYVKDSYSGRFFTMYDWFNSSWEIDYDDPNGDWIFGDPDQVKVQDGSMTLREAYEQYNLPFWFVKFNVYPGDDNDPMIDVYINNILIYTSYIFEKYDTENCPDIYIKTLPMHLINYGVDIEATPDESYTGLFTYPRLATTPSTPI